MTRLQEWKPRVRTYAVGLAGRACKRFSKIDRIFWRDQRSRCGGLLARLLALFPAYLLFVSPVDAQSVCGSREDIVNKLVTQYEETQEAAGIASNGVLLEVFTSASGSWTIIFTQPGGQTCLVAVGENWQPTESAAGTDPPV